MGAIKTTRSRVALNCSAKGEISPLDYSARVIVEMLPAYKLLKKDEDAPAFRQLLDLLDDIASRVKKHRYSQEALLTLVREEFLSGKSVFDLADLIGNTVNCFFPTTEDEPMCFRTVSQNPPVLRSDYGDEDYVPAAPVEKTRTKANPKPAKLFVVPDNQSVVPDNEIVPAPEKKLSDRPEIVALKKKYFELEKPDEKYFWKWKVSTDDYKEFKGLLLNVEFSTQTRAKVRECARQLCFYIAEWYKREYDGNESDRCLGELKIPSGFAKEIWEYTFQNGEQPYTTEDTNIREWLYSIYVLGGFPIKYTLRANRFSSLFDQIWGEDQNRDVISDEQLDDITLEFAGNQVVKNSLISGSLHDYYRYLRKKTAMPIAPSDVDKEPFASFIRNLQEGKKKYFEQYLKPVWLLYVDPHDSIVDGDIQVSFGRRDDKCYIPVECLSYWNIPGARTLEGFDIEVADSGSGEKKSIRFSKTGPGDYPFVGWSRLNKITLPLSMEEDSRIEVHLVTPSARYKIGNTFRLGDSRQFYKTKLPYEWSTRTDNSAHTSLLFNPSRLSIRDSSFRPEEKFFREGGKTWNWLPLTEEVLLEDESGNVVNFSPRNSSLEIVFKLMQNTVKYVNFRDVIYHQTLDGEHLQTAVTLLKGKDFTVKYTPFGADKADVVPIDRCSVSFKKCDDNRFIPWDDEHQPEQGLIRLRIIYEEKGVSSTRLVYYLPQSDPVVRIADSHLIRFGDKLERVYAPETQGYREMTRSADGCYRYYDSVINGFSPHSDTIPFLLGDPDGEYVILNVFRSAVCKELYLKGQPEPIKRYNQSEGYVEIPAILRRNFEVRSINSSGVSRARCGEDVYLRFDSSANPQDCFCSDAENGFMYYAVMNSRTILAKDGTTVTFILETSPAQYRFYYWSMIRGEEPVLLEQKEYDPDTKYLTFDISPLRKSHRGIVFQSLKDVMPRHYFAPQYGSLQEARFGRYELLVRCFDVASEHGVPFYIFPCMRELFQQNDVLFYLAQFWVALMVSRDWKPSSRDYASLHRLAYEFLFDWIMLPKVKWSQYVREWRNTLLEGKPQEYRTRAGEAFKEIMLRLFRTSPYIHRDDRGYLDRIVERYWSFRPNGDWNFRRSQSPENILAQCIRNTDKDEKCFDPEFDHRLSRLKRLHACKSLYEGLYRLMAKQ